MHSENVKVDCVIIISQNPILVISKSIVPETIDAFAECKGGSCDFINITESYLGDFFACIRDTPWVSSRWSLHSSRCSKLVSREFSSIELGVVVVFRSLDRYKGSILCSKLVMVVFFLS